MATKEKYRSRYSEHRRYNCSSGNNMKPIYEYQVTKTGETKLIQTGETNLYNEIQEHADSVKIENILKRLSMGDTSDFRKDGLYADMTKMPKNMVEAMQTMQHMENTWNNLPLEIKRKYNGDVQQFIGASGSEAWLIDMGLLNPGKEETIKATDTIPNTQVEIPESKQTE